MRRVRGGVRREGGREGKRGERGGERVVSGGGDMGG